ncbi:uncharacterized protein LOC119676624 [Teleopsis dalmanni]|uniref:uncharacterized protein LOC119676624 n=1 Tax=Teleopsis dalmanni TaxID=139649 RepID=UPI000D32AFB1|nr:uncharacterized protein LOC119676624 [Teleopsis dalmanni]
MFKFLCLLACVAATYAASIGSVESTTEKREIVPLLKFETDKRPDGSFRFTYEGGDKSFREESGVVENAGTDDEALEVSGSYRYIDADGREVEVHYTAGKNGFVPVGTNILSEITALAKAAADLPDTTEEEEVRRKARSKVEREDIKAVEAKVTRIENLKTVEKKEKIENVPSVKKIEQVDEVKKVEDVKKVENVEIKKVEEAKEVPTPKKVDSTEKVEKVAETAKAGTKA